MYCCMSGWSNFCTLVGHFSKLFEFAGLSRLKTPISVPKSEFSKKKKRSSLGIGLQNSYFRPKIRVFSKKKKKGLQLESISKIPILVPKSGCSLKKKERSSIGIDLRSFYFRPKIIAFFKKKVGSCRMRTTLLYVIAIWLKISRVEKNDKSLMLL